MNRHEFNTIASKAKEKHSCVKQKIGVCCGAGCISTGAEEVLKLLQEDIKQRGLESEVVVVPTGCM
jgi:NADH:ubiquinone oxidoreductase subunit E